MYYIVRGWQNSLPYEQTFDDLQAARAFLHQMEGPARLFVWLAGREEYTEINGR